MIASNTITAKRLADTALETIEGWLKAGRFPPGAHLHESGLCAELGISRTPIREALFKLESRGFLISSPNRGFFVPSPDPDAAKNIYPILAALEALALKTSPNFPEDIIARLKVIDRDMKAAKNSSSLWFQLDLDFHEKLTEPTLNMPLKDQLAGLYRHLRRVGSPKGSQTGYGSVIGALSAGNNARAAALIEQTWLKK